MSYPVPDTPLELLFEVKKSKFFAFAAYTPDRETAMQYLAGKREQYPDARHHCWAYLLGNPHSPASAAMSDDGEPSGTAGKPILNVLQHKGVGDITIIVTRYFGGIKLGAGGLVRAYSSAAQQVMENLTVKEQVTLSKVLVRADFRHEQFVRHVVNEHQGVVDHCEYANEVTMYIALPAPAISPLTQLCNGQGIQVTVPE
ncbi:IMPACT family protein [Alteromonas sp. AMM-1]|uniref:IMPACT family protein n=1 Tax=Alteromonas sp. AMM-1 TaxID=3394233 RepID=UPI0039A5D4CB